MVTLEGTFSHVLKPYKGFVELKRGVDNTWGRANVAMNEIKFVRYLFWIKFVRYLFSL